MIIRLLLKLCFLSNCRLIEMVNSFTEIKIFILICGNNFNLIIENELTKILTDEKVRLFLNLQKRNYIFKLFSE